MFYIIPRVNSTMCGQPYNVYYPIEQQYNHFTLLEENILAVGDENNTLIFFEITEKQQLEYITAICLGSNGTIRDLCPLTNTKEIYIVDGANCLLKLAIQVE